MNVDMNRGVLGASIQCEDAFSMFLVFGKFTMTVRENKNYLTEQTG